MEPSRATMGGKGLPASGSGSGPLKISFKLGGSTSAVASPHPSSVATPSPPASEAIDYTISADHSEADSHRDSPAPAEAKPTTVGGLLAAVPPSEPLPKDKPKRKRAPKRPPGEPGPGKHWRKGLKGNLAGTSTAGTHVPTAHPHSPSAHPPSHASASSHSHSAPPPPPVPSSRPFPIGPAPKIATTFLPPMALDTRTPRPRKWNRVVKELTSVTGMTLSFRSWQGRSNSPYADSQLAHLPTSPSHSPAPPAHSRSSSHLSHSPALPSALQFEAGQPPPRPNSDAAVATAPFGLHSAKWKAGEEHPSPVPPAASGP